MPLLPYPPTPNPNPNPTPNFNPHGNLRPDPGPDARRKVRAKYHAEGNFPGLWEKVRAEVDIIKGGDRVFFADNKKRD